MDAYPSKFADLAYSDEHPVLIAASSEAAMARAERTVAAADLRIGARLSIEAAQGRIEEQPKASAVWVELDRDCGVGGDQLLNAIARDVGAGRYAAVVSSTAETVDLVAARLDESDVEILIDAGDLDRTAALALALARRDIPSRYADAASDRSAERLRQLSDEMSRIASTLARLSVGPTPSPSPQKLAPAASSDVPPLSADTVRNVIRARRLRARYFAEELFADPAWDMLLDLLQAEIAQLRVPVSSLCIAAAVPATTALRWLKTLVAQGLFVRRPDPHDGRRVYVELAPDTSEALRRYFAELGGAVAI